jgi:quercetin dioxygenase-like cupin family protein
MSRGKTALSDNPRPDAGENPMSGKFVIANEIEVKIDHFGTSSRLSDPTRTGAKQLTVIDVNLNPSKGHNFHKHPDQEEVVLVVAGRVEQWVDREKRILGPGDSAFIPADVVHASFNAGDEPAKIIAILGPCVGADGYEAVDVANDAPWRMLRK